MAQLFLSLCGYGPVDLRSGGNNVLLAGMGVPCGIFWGIAHNATMLFKKGSGIA
jgi:hypothetical protein